MDCIFCNIVKNKIPSYKVMENDKFLAFLDINPISPGHTLVISKEHREFVWDVEEFGEYWNFAKDVAELLMKKLGAPMVEFLTHGTDVRHAHIWVVPIYKNECFIKLDNRIKFEQKDFEDLIQRIGR